MPLNTFQNSLLAANLSVATLQNTSHVPLCQESKSYFNTVTMSYQRKKEYDRIYAKKRRLRIKNQGRTFFLDKSWIIS